MEVLQEKSLAFAARKAFKNEVHSSSKANRPNSVSLSFCAQSLLKISGAQGLQLFEYLKKEVNESTENLLAAPVPTDDPECECIGKRDELSKTVITKLDTAVFTKSIEVKSENSYSEFSELTSRVQLLNLKFQSVLDLSRKKLGDRHVTVLARGFERVNADNSHIKHIIALDNRLTDEGIIALMGSITDRGIRTLNLSENLLHKRGAEYLGRYIMSNNCLEKLVLERMGLTDAVIRAIVSEVLRISNGVNTEDLSGNSVVSEFSQVTSEPRQIPKPSQPKPPISSKATSNSITKRKVQIKEAAPVEIEPVCFGSLSSLCLSSNEIGDTGAKLLASCMNRLSLTELDLSWNKILGQV